MPDAILPSVVSAASGLLGVAVGGYFTAINQRHERQQRRIGEQLAEFYSPMLGLRAKVRATNDVQRKITGAAASAWQTMMAYKNEADIDKIEMLTKERTPQFDRIIQYGNSQLSDVIIPAYRKMVELFISKMHLAEPSTIKHFSALLEYVEIWDRHVAESLPGEVMARLTHSEENLFPFYEDLGDTFNRLQQKLTRS